jgi:hypothetical protein
MYFTARGEDIADRYGQYYFRRSFETVIQHSREGILGQEYLAF